MSGFFGLDTDYGSGTYLGDGADAAPLSLDAPGTPDAQDSADAGGSPGGPGADSDDG